MTNEKQTFAKLCLLQDITFEGATAEQQAMWKDNVLDSTGTDGYGLADKDGTYILAEFSTDEIEFATVNCYNFGGSRNEQESFYLAYFITVREKATGDYYALETEDMDEF